MIVVILAGGGGERLWPFSRLDYPKQFLHFGDDLSFLQKTAVRFQKSKIANAVLISTNQNFANLVRKQLEKIDQNLCKNIIVEPCRRNTAPALMLCIRYILEKMKEDSNQPVLFLPSDHILEPEAEFLQKLEKVEPLIKDGSILAFGIHPDKPETGYGYIQLGSKLNKYFRNVQAFVEKPDKETAIRYVRSGNYLWNSGMFAFTGQTFLHEIKIHSPEFFMLSQTYSSTLSNYAKMPNISIDYALMEKTKNIVVCPLQLDWSDIGSWDSVYDVLEKDENQNVKRGNVIDIDTKNSLIIGQKRLISTIGLDDVLIVETNDVIFMAKKGESQKVKGLIQAMQARVAQPADFQSERIGKNQDYEIDILRFSEDKRDQISFPASTVWMLLKGTIQVHSQDETTVPEYSTISFERQKEVDFTVSKDSEILQLSFLASAEKTPANHF